MFISNELPSCSTFVGKTELTVMRVLHSESMAILVEAIMGLGEEG